MQQALRPYVTAGAALVGAGMIAVTPVATPLPGLSQLSRDVQLTSNGITEYLAGAVADATASVDTQLQDLVDNAQTSFGALGTALGSLATALSDPATAFSNLQTAFAAATFLAGDQKTFIDEVGGYSNNVDHAALLGILTLPENPLDPTAGPILPESVVPLVNFIASPLAGDLFGHVSPFAAAITPFLNPVMEFIAESQDGGTPDIAQLGEGLFQAPLDSLFGLFNGSTLDLDPLAPLISSSGLLPEGAEMEHLSLAFGGLFTPGETAAGPGSDAATATTGSGGSILNALGLELVIDNQPIKATGEGVGPIGGDAGLIYAISQALLGNLPPLEPAADPGTPTASTDFFSSLLGGGVLDQLFQELLSATGLDQIAQDLGLDVGTGLF